MPRAAWSRGCFLPFVVMPLHLVQSGTQRWTPQRGAYILSGKYQLEEPIGEGGMGSVWRAHQVALQRPVAVKFVKVDEPYMVERFLRETRLAASIRNPHVIDMFDFGTTPTGQPVLVMELLEGESLEDVLSRRSLGVHEAVIIMAQVLVALEAVHAAGIVHADLKPANVFLSSDGTDDPFVRIIDFGIAYSLDPESNLRRGRNGTDLRAICGTPEYMAPELAECLPDVDARADVYGAGVMLYELLSGVLPFESEHVGATLFKVMDGKFVPLVTLRPDIPELATIVTRAMARDRANRPQTAHALRVLLLETMPMISGAFRVESRALTDEEKAAIHARQRAPTVFESSSSSSSSSRSKWLGVALTALALGALGTLAVAWQSTSSSVVQAAPRVEEAAPPIVATPIAPAPSLEVEAEVPPDAAIAPEVHRVIPRASTTPEPEPSSPPPRVRDHGLRRDLDF